MALALTACGGKKEEIAPETSAQGTPASTMAADPDEIDVGSTMPAYSNPTLEGATFDLAQEKGNVVFLNLWATWCGPCRFEIPELQQIHNRYLPRGFKVVGVSVDESGADAVREFAKEYKMTYPVVLDPNGKLAVILRTSILPTSVIVDRNGKIVWKKYGPILPNDRSLESAVEAALGKT
jgi:thiol-disulfide isomerase/thioredoxin